MHRPKRYYRDMTRERAKIIHDEYFSKQNKVAGKRGITQKELSEKYGIPQSSVSRIVSGRVWV
jgi:predicted transcriptional regulator